MLGTNMYLRSKVRKIDASENAIQREFHIMRKLVGVLIVAIVCVFAVGIQVHTVQADQVVTVTITEAQLTQRVRELINGTSDIDTNVSVAIEERRLALNGNVVLNVNGGQRTTALTFSYKIVPYVSNGTIACRFASLQVGNRFATPEELRYINTAATNEACAQLFSPFLSAYPNARVRRISLHNHVITIQLTQIGEAVTGGCTVTTLSNVNLRSGPGAANGVITALPEGIALTVIGTQGNWLEVSYRDGSAWVYAPLVSGAGGCK
jgi:hypothetical protein